MKLCFFHLMPYQFLPPDFEKRYGSVWVDVPNDLFDPAKGHELYHDYLDELEYAESLGFDGLCVNEHHNNAYGLMPSPNLMAASMIRRTSNAAIVVLGNSLALYNPPVRVAEEFAMLDVMSGGRLVAGFPLGTSMDTVFAYGQIPATLREKYLEGPRPRNQGLDRAQALPLQRQIHPDTLRRHLAPTLPTTPSPHMGARLRQLGNLGLHHRLRLRLLLPQLPRLQSRQDGPRRLLGRTGPTRKGLQPPTTPDSSSWLLYPSRTTRLTNTRTTSSTSSRNASMYPPPTPALPAIAASAACAAA